MTCFVIETRIRDKAGEPLTMCNRATVELGWSSLEAAHAYTSKHRPNVRILSDGWEDKDDGRVGAGLTRVFLAPEVAA